MANAESCPSADVQGGLDAFRGDLCLKAVDSRLRVVG